MKIFEIGVAKTGTTSLRKALKILGLNCKGFSKECYCPTLNPTFKDSWPVMCDVADKYDAFTDGPWHDVSFKLWDKRYPNSKFIILERDDESWIWSAYSFFNGKTVHDPIVPENKIIEFTRMDKDPSYREYYSGVLEWKKEKYDGIKKYFKDRPNDLLVMNICDGDGWEKLCPFLNKEIPDIPFPKKNVNDWLSEKLISLERKYGGLIKNVKVLKQGLGKKTFVE